jgi:hypothetical protein
VTGCSALRQVLEPQARALPRNDLCSGPSSLPRYRVSSLPHCGVCSSLRRLSGSSLGSLPRSGLCSLSHSPARNYARCSRLSTLRSGPRTSPRTGPRFSVRLLLAPGRSHGLSLTRFHVSGLTSEAYRIYFARRGKSDRTEALMSALELSLGSSVLALDSSLLTPQSYSSSCVRKTANDELGGTLPGCLRRSRRKRSACTTPRSASGPTACPAATRTAPARPAARQPAWAPATRATTSPLPQDSTTAGSDSVAASNKPRLQAQAIGISDCRLQIAE